jgi:autotransporter-associated beta strand protein
LTAGQAYPIYAAFSEGGGDDYLRVAFKLSTDSSYVNPSASGSASNGYGYYFNGTPNTGVTLTGPVTLNNNATISSANATIQISGSISDGGTSKNLTIANGTSYLSNINITGAVTANQVSLTSRNMLLGGDYNLASSMAVSVTNAATVSGAIKGANVTLTKTSAGSLTLNGSNTYTGNTTISAGSLIVGGSGSLNSGNYSGAINNAGTFQYSSSANQTLGGAISGAGPLIKNTSSSILTLSTNNTYTGATTVNAGTLTLTGKIYCPTVAFNT